MFRKIAENVTILHYLFQSPFTSVQPCIWPLCKDTFDNYRGVLKKLDWDSHFHLLAVRFWWFFAECSENCLRFRQFCTNFKTTFLCATLYLTIIQRDTYNFSRWFRCQNSFGGMDNNSFLERSLDANKKISNFKVIHKFHGPTLYFMLTDAANVSGGQKYALKCTSSQLLSDAWNSCEEKWLQKPHRKKCEIQKRKPSCFVGKKMVLESSP